jgi:hypothetical protein
VCFVGCLTVSSIPYEKDKTPMPWLLLEWLLRDPKEGQGAGLPQAGDSGRYVDREGSKKEVARWER